jgi:hypothetical protein
MSVSTEISIASARKAFFSLAAVLYCYRVSFGEVDEADTFFSEVFDLKGTIDFSSLFKGYSHLEAGEIARCEEILNRRMATEQGQDLAARKPLDGHTACLDVSVLGVPENWSASSKDSLAEAIARNNWRFSGRLGGGSLLAELSTRNEPSPSSAATKSSRSSAKKRRESERKMLLEQKRRESERSSVETQAGGAGEAGEVVPKESHRASTPRVPTPSRTRTASPPSRATTATVHTSRGNSTRSAELPNPQQSLASVGGQDTVSDTTAELVFDARPAPASSLLASAAVIAFPSGGIRPQMNVSNEASVEQSCYRKRVEYLKLIYEAILSCGIANFSAIDAAVIISSRTGIALETELIPAINGLSHLSMSQADSIARSFPQIQEPARRVWTDGSGRA